MKTFDYHRPSGLAEAVSLLRRYGAGARALAGGTDLVLEMRKGSVQPDALIDLKNIPELRRFEEEGESLRIGSLQTIREIATAPLTAQKCPLLKEAALVVGSYQVRNRATLGGNICHASPAADTVPSLLCLGCQLKILGPAGERTIALEDFFLGPGKTALRPGEILREIVIRKQAQRKGTYLKLSPRKATDLAVVGIAVLGQAERGRCTEVKIAMGAVAPKPMRALAAEQVLMGREINGRSIQEAAEKAMRAASPITDIRGSDWYRREMVGVLVQKGLSRLGQS